MGRVSPGPLSLSLSWSPVGGRLPQRRPLPAAARSVTVTAASRSSPNGANDIQTLFLPAYQPQSASRMPPSAQDNNAYVKCSVTPCYRPKTNQRVNMLNLCYSCSV